jgi:hypothetical protein
MNQMIVYALNSALAIARDEEKHAREIADSIENLMRDQFAAVKDMIHVDPRAAIASLKIGSPTASVPPPARGPTGKAPAIQKPGPRTWPKTCVSCGKNYAALSASSKCCSPECVKEKNIRYSRAGYQAKAGKPAPKAAAPKAAKAPTGYQKVCVVCGKPYTPTRKDQKCCSTVCGKRRHLEAKPAPKAEAPTAKQERDQAGGQTRIERLKVLAGFVDPIPQRVRDAAAEARDSENMG